LSAPQTAEPSSSCRQLCFLRLVGLAFSVPDFYLNRRRFLLRQRDRGVIRDQEKEKIFSDQPLRGFRDIVLF